MFAKALLSRGWRLDANFAIPMVDNYVLMYDVADEARRGAALSRAEGMIDGIVGSIRERAEGDRSACTGAFPRFMTAAMYPLYGLSRSTRKFRAGPSCTACGFCSGICPSGAIVIEDGRPRWTAGKCVHCLACIHRCPSRAIEYGRGTAGHGRYRNPLAPASW
jgi:ferredoxin